MTVNTQNDHRRLSSLDRNVFDTYTHVYIYVASCWDELRLAYNAKLWYLMYNTTTKYKSMPSSPDQIFCRFLGLFLLDRSRSIRLPAKCLMSQINYSIHLSSLLQPGTLATRCRTPSSSPSRSTPANVCRDWRPWTGSRPSTSPSCPRRWVTRPIGLHIHANFWLGVWSQRYGIFCKNFKFNWTRIFPNC